MLGRSLFRALATLVRSEDATPGTQAAARLHQALALAEEATRICAQVCHAPACTREAMDRIGAAEEDRWRVVNGLVLEVCGVEEGPAAVILDGRVLAVLPPDGGGGTCALHEFLPLVSVPAARVAVP
jgi:hypothetical protein